MQARVLGRFAIGLFVVAPWLALSARGELYGFTPRGGEMEGVAPQLFVNVQPVDDTHVAFRFTNVVGIDSSITGITFSGGPLARLQDVDGADGVAFTSRTARPAAQVGSGHTRFTTIFDLNAVRSQPSNGVDQADEFLNVVFELRAGASYADLVSALQQGAGGFQIGLRVRPSEGQMLGEFINGPAPVPVPLPGAALLGVLGLAAVPRLKRRLSA